LNVIPQTHCANALRTLIYLRFYYCINYKILFSYGKDKFDQ
jgi:hypothetical protein